MIGDDAATYLRCERREDLADTEMAIGDARIKGVATGLVCSRLQSPILALIRAASNKTDMRTDCEHY
jgi:hypothetical protein